MKKILMFVLFLLVFLGGVVGGDMLGSGKVDVKIDGYEKVDGYVEVEKFEVVYDVKVEDEVFVYELVKFEGEVVVQDWFKFLNQFFVLVMCNGRMDVVMVLFLMLEILGDVCFCIEV